MNYLLAKSNTVSGYGGCTYQEIFEDDVYDGRYARVISASFPTDDAAFIVGFWMTPTAQALPQSIVYRADQNFIARIVDADGWRWWWPLPSTGGAWSRAYFVPENAQLTTWQPKPAEDPRPSTLNMVPLDQITILLDGAAADATFAYYAVNELPPYVHSIVPTSFGPLRIKVGTDVALPASGHRPSFWACHPAPWCYRLLPGYGQHRLVHLLSVAPWCWTAHRACAPSSLAAP